MILIRRVRLECTTLYGRLVEPLEVGKISNNCFLRELERTHNIVHSLERYIIEI